VLFSASRFEDALLHRQTRSAQPSKPAARHFRVGIPVTDGDKGQAGFENQICARTRSTAVAARLEGHRQARAAQGGWPVLLSRTAERHHLGVFSWRRLGKASA